MKVIKLTFFCFFMTLSLKANAQELEIGKWNFVLENDYCYIGSLPTEKDIPEGKTRGDTYILVYRMNKSSDSIIQIDAGYPYDNDKPVEVIIDKNIYEFYSQEDSAWTEKDKKVIEAMKKGINLNVKGFSSRGTLTVDTYTLKGFTSAFNTLSKGC